MTTVALLVQLDAKPEHAEELNNLLKDGVAAVNAEAGTPVWFAFRAGPTRFGIFDAFPDDAARTAHLGGRLAKALLANAERVLSKPPSIEKVDILAEKVPGLR